MFIYSAATRSCTDKKRVTTEKLAMFLLVLHTTWFVVSFCWILLCFVLLMVASK